MVVLSTNDRPAPTCRNHLDRYQLATRLVAMNDGAQLFLFDLGPATTTAADVERVRLAGIRERVDHDLAMWGAERDDDLDLGYDDVEEGGDDDGMALAAE